MVRRLMKNLGYITYDTMRRFLSEGRVIGCPLTSVDVSNAEEVYGPPVEQVKGKSTAHRPRATPRPEMLPRTRTEQAMHGDILWVEGIPFVNVKFKPSNFGMVTKFPSRKPTGADLLKILNIMIHLVYQQGFRIIQIYWDDDPILKPIKYGRILHQIPFSLTGAGSHEPVSERQGRTIQERARCIVADAGFPVCLDLIVHVVYFACTSMNWISMMAGQPSPREAVLGRKLDMRIDCLEKCLQFCQIYKDNRAKSSSILLERTEDALYLGPVDNGRGTGRFWPLKSKIPVSRDHWTPCKLTESAYAHLVRIYKADAAVYIPVPPRPVYRHIPPAHVREDVPVEGDQVEPLEEVEQLPNAEATPTPSDGAAVEGEDQQRDQVSDGQPADDSLEVADYVRVMTHDNGCQWSWACKMSGQTWAHDYYQADNNENKVKLRPATPQLAEEEEMAQLVRKDTFAPVWFEPNIRTVNCRMLIQPKEGGWKGRFVAMGYAQDMSVHRETSSPTVSNEVVLFVLAIMAAEKRHARVLDIVGAYLEAYMDEVIYIKLNVEQSRAVLKIKPDWTRYLHNGQLYMKLLKALYGLKQSAKLWFNLIDEVLKAVGFQPNPKDPCCYNRMVCNNQATVCLHVDDMLITHQTDEGCLSVQNLIKQQFKNIRVKHGMSIIYLGMELSRKTNGDVQLGMMEYTEKIISEWRAIREWRVVKKSPTPALETLFEDNEESPLLGDKQRKIFHTFAAKGLYLAKRTRSDILTVISVLCGRVREPRIQDLERLDRVYQYLNNTRNLCVVFDSCKTLEIEIYSDASYMTRPSDMMSRTGVMVMVNGGVVATMSNWQKLITKSSTGAEFIALTEAVSYALYLREWLRYQNRRVPRMKIHCDNQSVLALLKANHTGVKATKHLKVRYFFIRQHVISGEIEIVWCKTIHMIADIMTKPVTGQLFKDMIGRFLYARCETME